MQIWLMICVVLFSACLGGGLAALLATVAFCRYETQDLVYRIAFSAPLGAVVGALAFPWFYFKANGCLDVRFMTLFFMSCLTSCVLCVVLSWFGIGWIGMGCSVLIFIAIFSICR